MPQMVPLTDLVVPILLSAVIVFVASSIIHMVLPWHKNDMRQVPQEDLALETLRKIGLAPGEYGMPHPGSRAGMKSPAFTAKLAKGPVVFMTVAPGSRPTMAPQLVQWFVFTIVVSIFGGYIAGRAVGPGTDYLQVFRFAGCTAFAGYSLAFAPMAIWFHRPWTTTIKSMIDGLVYGLLTGGTFGWLWPK